MVQSPKRVLCIGECMVELSPAGDGLLRQNFAGDSYNTAIYLARQFSPAIEVSYCTGLGAQGLSLSMLEAFRAEAIKVDHVRLIEEQSPGLYMIQNDASGERTFQYWRGQSAAKQMFAGQTEDQLAEEFSAFDALYLTGISLAILDDAQRETLFAALQKIGTTGNVIIVFDPNFRPALWPDKSLAKDVIATMAALSDIALVTLDDDLDLWGEQRSMATIAAQWQQWGAKELVIKHGSADCVIRIGRDSWDVPTPQKMSPIDTTGAGDSFAAGYLGARLLGDAPIEAVELAHQVAGQVIMHPGGVIAKDVWQTIERS